MIPAVDDIQHEMKVCGENFARTRRRRNSTNIRGRKKTSDSKDRGDHGVKPGS